MVNTIKIHGINKLTLLRALWENQGHRDGTFGKAADLNERDAHWALAGGYIPQLFGRPMKLDLTDNTVNPKPYDDYAGPGTFKRIVKSLNPKKRKAPDQLEHASKLLGSKSNTRRHTSMEYKALVHEAAPYIISFLGDKKDLASWGIATSLRTSRITVYHQRESDKDIAGYLNPQLRSKLLSHVVRIAARPEISREWTFHLLERLLGQRDKDPKIKYDFDSPLEEAAKCGWVIAIIKILLDATRCDLLGELHGNP